VAALTQTLVIPVQPELPRLLHTTAGDAAWVITVTLLAGALSAVLSGRLADMFGKKRILIGSAGLLIVGSAVCALSATLPALLAGRTLQGLSMGFISVGISLMREITPPEMSTTAVAAMSGTLGVGGAVGLPLAALVAQDADWHLLFWLSAICAAVVLALVALLVPAVRDAHGGRLDLIGAAGLTLGLGAVLLGLTKANSWGWASPPVWSAIGGGVLALVLWGWYELRRREPIVDLRASVRRPILMTNLAAIAVGFGMMAQSIVQPQWREGAITSGQGMGQSMIETGLWMAPSGLVMMLFAPVSARLIKRIGPKLTLAIGATVLGGAYLLSAVFLHNTWLLALAAWIGSAGVGIAYSAMPTLILDATPEADAAAAVGLNALARAIGTTSASAAMGAILATMLASGPFGGASPGALAYVVCFVVAAAAAFLGAAISFAVPRGDLVSRD
jgi:MFS family permease